VEDNLAYAFLESLRLKGRSPSTLKNYRLSIGCFAKFLTGQRVFSFFAATEKQAQSYACRVRTKGYSRQTAFKKHYEVYAFYRYLQENGDILLNPFRKPELPTIARIPRNVPDMPGIVKAYKKAFKYLRGSKRLHRQRDYIMLELGFGCGLRRCELRNLNVEDINADEGSLRVIGKFKKERLVPIGKKALKELMFYVYRVRPRFFKGGGKTNALFLSRLKGGKRICDGTIDSSYRRLRATIGFDKRITSHGLRHAFATALLRSGARIQDISKMLGHERLSTTQIYTRALPADLKREHQKHHPRG
jgi:site-specific recombinase XerD